MTKKNQGLNILGIETSCDETAVAIVNIQENYKGKILSNKIFSQDKEHSPYGGVVPEIASRSHVEHLDDLIDQALKDTELSFDSFDGIAVTSGPGLIGGLIVGMATAKGLSLATNVPLIGVNHLEGHALTPLLTNDTSFPYILLLVSGGHCQLIIVEELGKYSQIGTTLDDAVGEAFDKTAKLLGLGYPGGPAIAAAAQHGTPERYRFPRPMTDRPGLDFSFSGLKTYARNTVAGIELDERTIADVAWAFQDAAIDTLVIKCTRALEKTRRRRLVIAGGVGANIELRKRLAKLATSRGFGLYYPRPAFCTDNGAMIAYAGWVRLAGGQRDGPGFSIRPRWPLTELLPID